MNNMSDDFYDMQVDENRSYVDRRCNEMLPIASEPSVDISTQLMKEKIHRIHCNQLERATNGRLTWRGDEIVSTTGRLRERESAVAIIRKQIEKLEAQSKLKESHAQCSGRPDASPIQAASARSQCDACISDCPVAPH
jgi:hypothetical protein